MDWSFTSTKTWAMPWSSFNVLGTSDCSMTIQKLQTLPISSNNVFIFVAWPILKFTVCA
jgi:hypothetical protein